MKVKNVLYAGLGIGNVVEKKLYDHYENLIKEGKEKDPQINSVLERFFENIDDQKQEAKDKYGLYHVVNKGDCTWYEVAQQVAEILGHGKDRVTPIETKDFYTNLKRPQDTSLNVRKVEIKFGIKVPTWPDALTRFFNNEVL